jgi:hypothetical protein
MYRRRSLAILPVLILVALLLVFYARREPDRGLEMELHPVLDVGAQAAEQPGAIESSVVLPAGTDARSEAETVASAREETAAAIEDENLATVRGRCVYADGGVAVGVQVKVHGWAGNSERALQFGVPDNWEDVSGETDAQGRFALRLDPPRAFQFTLNVSQPGFAAVNWRWFELLPRKVKDVGEVVLVPGGSVHGRILDKQGKPVGGNRTVSGNSALEAPGDGGDTTRVRANADPLSGEFLLEGLPPGPAQITASSSLAQVRAANSALVVSRGTVEFELVYDGPDNSRRIVVTTFCREFHIFNNPAEGSIVLLGAGAERTAKRVPGRSQDWSFEDVEPGAYTIELRDPRFLPWSESNVRPGSQVRAYLRGNASVALNVIDEQGAPVENYRLRVDFHTSKSSPHEFELRDAKSPLPAGGVYSSLIPGAQTLRVDVDGYSTSALILDALAPNESRGLTMQLSRGTRLEGVVLDIATRKPLAGVDVALGVFVEPTPAGANPGDSFSVRLNSRRAALRTQSDANGRCSFG